MSLRRPQTQTPLENRDRHLWQITPARDLIILLLIALLLWALFRLRAIFLPLLIALILAHIFNPLVRSLERRWGCPRPLTAAVLLAVGFFAIAGFLSWLGPLLLEQITELMLRLPEYLRSLAASANVDLGNVANQIERYLRQYQLSFEQILTQVFKTTGHALDLVTLIFSAAGSLLFSVALVFIYFFLFSWHFDRSLGALERYLPQSCKARILDILAQMDEAVGNFFRGRLVIAIIMGCLLSLGWFLTGVPYWFFLGMLTGLLNIVPYLSIITWPAAILLKYAEAISATEGQDINLISILLWPSAVYVAVQLLEGWLLTPWIQSGQTNLSPAIILIVVFVGAALAGILGMLLAIPVAACAKILFKNLLMPRVRQWAREH